MSCARLCSAALRPATPPACRPSSCPHRSSSIARRPPALILPLRHPQSLVLPSSPVFARSSSRHRLPTRMTRVPPRLTWTCHVPVSITPPSLRPSLTTMLLNVQRSCACSSTTRTHHPHHTCHPLPAQTIDLCLPSLLSLNFAYPPVGEPNSEPVSPPSPS